ALRFANWQTDQLIRSASRAAEIADGGSRGPIHAAAFPDGLAPVVAPGGARQVKPTEELVARITKSKLTQIEAYRTEWGPKLEASLAALRTAAGAYEAARKDLLDVFQTELALRDEHRLAIERLLGQVRTAFPGDASKRDLVFPVLDDAVPSDPAADDEPVVPTPAG
ncbi:MAG: hypothetical protein IT373_31195, partial [Polyangiaceae bacterium]|nr:hypothetical protein [Polyangiaceae bacterium]